MVENIRMAMMAALCALVAGCAHWAPMPAPMAMGPTTESVRVGHQTVVIMYSTQQERAGILCLLGSKEDAI